MNKVEKVFVSCYAFSKYRGSEYRAGRKSLIALSDLCEVTSCVGLVGDHMGEFSELWGDDALKIKKLRIVLVRPPVLARFLNIPNRLGVLKFTFYLAFPFWHKAVFKLVKGIIHDNSFNILHQMNPVGFREPGFLWKLEQIKFVWGPVGGVKTVNRRNLQSLNIYDRIFYTFKNVVTRFQFMFSRRVRAAVERADKIIFATPDTKRAFESYWGKTGLVIPEQGFDFSASLSSGMLKNENVVIWTGDPSKRKNFRLYNDVARYYHMTYDKGVTFLAMGISATTSDVVCLGRLSQRRVKETMLAAKVGVITSFNEGNPAVLLELIASGCAITSFRHSGMEHFVEKIGGVLVDENQDYSDIISAFAKGIYEQIQSDIRVDAYDRVIRENSWNEKTNKYLSIYNA